MINKRLLIKKLLSHNGENSFYDKKLNLIINTTEGKAKFLKHICALTNSNPKNRSYLVIGVKDEDNTIVGVDFFDDAKIQNLINAYLVNPPKIEYENVPFPRLKRHKVVGLVTIHANPKVSYLKKNIWKYLKGTLFYRRGSVSIPVYRQLEIKNSNQSIVNSIEKSARNNIEHTLNGVFDFINNHIADFNPQYKVFKEQFVLCWAGKSKVINGEEYLTRVDIELINEQVRLFFSDLDDVQITYNENSFIITEYITLGVDHEQKLFPLEKTIINFKDNGKHDIVSEFLFIPPQYNAKLVDHIYQNCTGIINKIKNNTPLSVLEHQDVEKLPNHCLISYLHGYEEAGEELREAKEYIKQLADKTIYIKFKEALRVIRKVKYA